MNKELEAYLRLCNQAYAEGNPLIPDEVYDRLVENTELENEVGHIEVGEQRYKHPYQMYSHKTDNVVHLLIEMVVKMVHIPLDMLSQ